MESQIQTITPPSPGPGGTVSPEQILTSLEQHSLVSTTDLGGNITWVNDRFCEVTGYSREELIGRNHRLMKSDQHEPAFYAALWETITAGNVWQGVLCNRRRDGRRYWVQTSIVPVLDECGDVSGFMAIRTDISEPMRGREALQQKNDLLQLLSNTGKLALDTPHGEFDVLFESLATTWCRQIGADSTALYKYQFGRLVELLRRSNRAELNTIADNLPRELADYYADSADSLQHITLITPEESPGLLPGLWRDGNRGLLSIPVHAGQDTHLVLSFTTSNQATVTLWREQFSVFEILAEIVSSACHRDIYYNTIRYNERSLRKRQYYAHVGDWDLAISTSTVHWSPTLFGFDEELTDIKLDAFLAIVHADDREPLREALHLGIHSNHAMDVEFRLIQARGVPKWLKLRGSKVIDEQNFDFYLLGTIIDIDDSKRAEQELIHAREVADRANAAKSSFLSNMSHELRTPLNSILGFGQLIELDSSAPETHRDSAREINSAGRHLLELINEILDLASIESGKTQLALEPVPVRDIIGECLSLMGTLATERQVDLQAEPLPDVCICVDRTRLKQALINLLSNGIKYNRPGGSVTLSAELGGRGSLCIYVTDTGIGVAQEFHHHIFEPFNRLGIEAAREEGTGIGLSYTKQVVEQMGGSIHFESSPGCGSTFWLVFPDVRDCERCDATPSRPE